ncbi:MAG: DinB family protein [Vicinamibacterales bacterium]|nr:DinB family protein [Vicinamibacterales bacterium]
MRIIEWLLPEYDREMGLTRRALARVPMDRADFRPHPRSMTLGALATHLATMPSWATETMTRTELGLRSSERIDPLATREALVAAFDGHVSRGRTHLASASDAELMVPWSFLVDDEVLFTMPRLAVLRTFVLNHTVHHRGQLTVYLRLLDVPVPSLYGPSADEGTR